MKESTLVNKIIAWFKKVPGLWYMKTHGGPFGRAGIPDLLVCYKGQFYAVECKVGSNTPTDLQLHELEALSEAGAKTTVAYDLATAQRLVLP